VSFLVFLQHFLLLAGLVVNPLPRRVRRGLGEDVDAARKRAG